MAGNGKKGGSDKLTLKLTDLEFRAYNRMAQRMDYFHNHFRYMWQQLEGYCNKYYGPQAPPLNEATSGEIIALGLTFCRHLHLHHTIEEQHIFPALATKMPGFGMELELVQQHKEIHCGLDGLKDYLRWCQSCDKKIEVFRMKEIMNSFGAVLWAHLDDEVKILGAENMRKYWTMDDMRRLPM